MLRWRLVGWMAFGMALIGGAASALTYTNLLPGDSYGEGFGSPDTSLYAQSFMPNGNRLDEINLVMRHAGGTNLHFQILVTAARNDGGGGMNMAPDMTQILFVSEPLVLTAIETGPTLFSTWPSIPVDSEAVYFVVIDSFTPQGPPAAADIAAWSFDVYADGEFVFLNAGDLALALLADANQYEWDRWFYTADLALKLIYDQPPFVRYIRRAGDNPTNASSVDFTVKFTHAVSGVDPSDFHITASGLEGTSLASVTPIDAATYTVRVNTGTGDGAMRLDLLDDDSIQDDTNLALNDVGVGNGDFTSGESYTIDKTPPSLLIGIPSSDRTRYLPVSYEITYDGADSVTLAPSDITLVRTGSASGAPFVSGSGPATRTVTVAEIRGEGTLSIQIGPGSARDIAGNLAPASGVSTTFQVLLATDLDSDRDGLLDMQEDENANGMWDHVDPVFPMRWPYPGNETDLHNWDTDGDGVSDSIEIVLGTNPLDPESPPHAPGETGVPAVSALGLAVLAVLLTGVACVAFRRKPSIR